MSTTSAVIAEKSENSPSAGRSRLRMSFPDALRAFAALLVVLPHSVGFFVAVSASSDFTRQAITIALLARTGVQIFFVLSGFVIAYTLGKQKVTPRYLGVFILRRSVRLDPPYWCAILLSILFLALRAKTSPGHVHLPGVGAVVVHMFYLQNILNLEEINVVFWTLCIEVQLYIVFCALIGVVQALGSRIKVSVPAFFVGTYIVSLLWPAGLLSPTPGYFIEWWYAFIVGAIVWWACDGRIRWWVAVLLIVPLFPAAIHTHAAAGGVAGATALLLLWCGRVDGLHRWFQYKPVLLLGRLSYCLYLVHVPVAGVLLAVFTRMRPTHQAEAYAALFSTYFFSLVLAYFLHRAVELPALRLSQKLKSLYKNPPRKIDVEDR